MLYLKPNCTEPPFPCFQEAVNQDAVNQDAYKEKNIQNKECSGANPTTTTYFDIFSLFEERGIPSPKGKNSYIDGIIAKAIDRLSYYGFTMESYLDYLTNECGQWVFEPHNGRVNDFFVILRPLNIDKGCNGKFEDRICQ